MYSEGKALIAVGKAFLNDKAKESRDVSLAYVAVTAKKGSKLIDTTAATGIRSIRYMLEGKIKNVVALEINKNAYTALKSNVKKNKVSVKAINTSIQEFSNFSKERYDFIDLDPFGGITPYIYDLMKISKDGTELMVTATDTAVLCGANRKACIRLYNSKPIHNEICHESGLRIMVGYIATVAAQFGFGIRVQLSFSYMHYMRAFVKLEQGAEEAYESVAGMGFVYYCEHCGHRAIERSMVARGGICPLCKKQIPGYGRMWLGSLKDKIIVDDVLKFLGRQNGMEGAMHLVEKIGMESNDPFYYHIPTLTKKLGLGSVSPRPIVEELRKKGFSATYTHMSDSAIRTNAGIADILPMVKKLRNRP